MTGRISAEAPPNAAEKVQAEIVEFLQLYCGDQIDRLNSRQYDDKNGSPVLEISLSDIARKNNDLLDDLLKAPDKIIPWFLFAVRNYDTEVQKLREKHDEFNISPLKKPDPKHSVIPQDTRVEFIDPTKDVYRDIGAPRDELFQSVVAFEGICQQVSDPKSRVLEAKFVCERCGAESDYIDFSDTFEIDPPKECSSCERQGPWRRKKEADVTEEYQQLHVQESPGDAVNASNPREIVAESMGPHLMDRVEDGDRVTVVGVLREDGDKDSTLLDSRLEILSIIPEEVQFEEVEFDEDDVEKIQELADSPDLFENIRESIAPTIFGYDDRKLAVALQMFGGVSREVQGNRKRGELHIMFIGDPGVGKSQILESARTLAPRAMSSSGTGASAVGLTASAQQETIGGEEQWTLQAGSLALADGGVITIDELDNMDYDEQQSLLQALSEGIVTVDKAKIHADLNARCSALMAANPEHGRFDPMEPLGEQFDMPTELLDRCDLIFPFEDTPDEEVDEEIADTILNTHSGTADPVSADGGVHETGLISPDLFQKYVAYARRNYDPSIGEEAHSRLKEWYLTIRELGEQGQVAINPRFLDGAIRISQASARARLSDTVEQEDTDRAIELVMSMLNELGYDGQYDVDRTRGEAGGSQKQRRRTIQNVVTDHQRDYENGVPIGKVVSQAAEDLDVDEDTVRDEIDAMVKANDRIYEPAEGGGDTLLPK